MQRHDEHTRNGARHTPGDDAPQTRRWPARFRGAASRQRRGGVLAGMRIRKKLLLLHTVFWLVFAAAVVGLIRPGAASALEEARAHEAGALAAAASRALAYAPDRAVSTDALRARLPEGVTLSVGSADELAIDAATADEARRADGVGVAVAGQPTIDAVAWIGPVQQGADQFVAIRARPPGAEQALRRLDVLLLIALVGAYGLVIIALEALVLPQQVYGPIRRMLEADRAVRDGREGEELIADRDIPADELGQIMRSRNEAIVSIRQHEHALGDALSQLEGIASDMKRKNHLLETAKRNLADADRLASLGMMSAGVAHELNTPLAVLKGLAEKAASGSLEPHEAALMTRVMTRLERLSESLLDVARASPPRATAQRVRRLAEEACAMVRLDRAPELARVENTVGDDLVAECDGDKMVQVLVNLVRNAVDAIEEHASAPGRVVVAADVVEREDQPWVSITITDDGPGIEPGVLRRVFEPFVSSRLDARGAGLGLAVADGIVREHGGVLLARNRPENAGAVFEIMLPKEAAHAPEGAANALEGAT